MSIAAHPNIHAVKLAVGLCTHILIDKMLPTYVYVKTLFRECLRGEAKNKPDLEEKVDLMGMVESLMVLCDDRFKHDDAPAVGQYIVSFCAELSERLDAAVDNAG